AEATIDVRPAIGADAAPRFVRPVGFGTTLDLARASCLDLDVEVFDPDTASVELGLAGPHPDGASLRQGSATTAAFRFCPSARDLDLGTRHPVAFTAADGDHPVVRRPYLL